MNETTHDDALEERLGSTLHRLAAGAPDALLQDGRSVVERKVRERAVHRRRMLGAGAAAAVVALAAGALVLRPDPATTVSFGDQPARPAAGVVTGYATGSVTGSPTGWTTRYDAGPDEVDLPRLLPDLDASWQPRRVSATLSDQGAGTAATPMQVLADGTGYVIVSVQPVSTLGPGRGEATRLGGRAATVVRQNDGVVQAIVDLGAGHRALVTAGGVDPAELSSVVASIHQQGATWAIDAPSGSSLRPVPTDVPSSYRQRVLEWQRTATTAVASTPEGKDDALTISISTGGAYEFYGQIAQRAAWSHLVPVDAASTHLAGVTFVGAAAFEDATSSTVIGYDAQGVVYEVERWSGSAETGATPILTPMQISLAPATGAAWAQLVTAAAQAQFADAVANQQARQQKEAAVRANGGAGSPDPAGAPAGAPVSTSIP